MTPDFDDVIYVAIPRDADGEETLEAAFAPEDLEATDVAVYELKSVGRVERTARFVETTQLEQLRRKDATDVSGESVR